MGFEIERKFLIRYPDVSAIFGEVWDIEQIYLTAPAGETRRIRRVISNGTESFFYTEKRRITSVTRIENEREITRDEYAELKANRDPALNVIEKRRIRIPIGGHLWELDLFPFWSDRAILEIELSSESEPFEIPSFFELIREVTEESAYTNRSMAKKIPEE